MHIGIVDQEYAKKGIGIRCFQILMNQHPLISRAKQVIVEVEGLAAANLVSMLGFREYWAMPYEKFKKIKGLEEFGKFQELMAENGLNPKLYEKYAIYYLDRLKVPRL